MEGGDSLSAIFLVKFDFPAPVGRVQYREYGSVTEGVDTVVHIWDVVWITNREGREIATVTKEFLSSIFLGFEYNLRRLLCLHRFDNIPHQHFVCFLFLKLACPQSGSVSC